MKVQLQHWQRTCVKEQLALLGVGEGMKLDKETEGQISYFLHPLKSWWLMNSQIWRVEYYSTGMAGGLGCHSVYDSLHCWVPITSLANDLVFERWALCWKQSDISSSILLQFIKFLPSAWSWAQAAKAIPQPHPCWPRDALGFCAYFSLLPPVPAECWGISFFPVLAGSNPRSSHPSDTFPCLAHLSVLNLSSCSQS